MPWLSYARCMSNTGQICKCADEMVVSMMTSSFNSHVNYLIAMVTMDSNCHLRRVRSLYACVSATNQARIDAGCDWALV